MQIFKEFGTVTQPPSPLHGHHCIITLAVLTAVKELYEWHSDTYLDKLQWFLAIHHDIVISISVLQENLNKAGLMRKMLRKITHKRDEERRAKFLHLIFLVQEENSWQLMSLAQMIDVAHRYGHAPVGQPAELIDPFIDGEHYSLVAALSKTGYLATHVVP